jgi:hypothetical protein
MIVRIFKLFDFQPRMGVITRSLALAGPELLNFFILWLIFFVGYSFMAHMIFGRSVEDVSPHPPSVSFRCFSNYAMNPVPRSVHLVSCSHAGVWVEGQVSHF